MTLDQFIERLKTQKGQYFIAFTGKDKGKIRHISLKDFDGEPSCPMNAQPECRGLSNSHPILMANKLGIDSYWPTVTMSSDNKPSCRKYRKEMLEALGLEEIT